MKLLCVLLPVCALAADPAAVLSRARQFLAEEIQRFPKYTCTETIDRTYFRGPEVRSVSCDDVIARHRMGRSKVEPYATDRLRFDVEIADGGYEIVSWPGAGKVGAERLEDLASGGPIGTGPFGPFLIDIFTNTAARIDFVRAVGGELEYRFTIPKAASRYRVGLDGLYWPTGYSGVFRLDSTTARLTGLQVRTAELPSQTGSCEATTTVDFQVARIGYDEYLIPQQSRLRVVGRGSETENAAVYSRCREFHGESEIHFDADPGATSAAPTAAPARPEKPLPAGLPVRLALQAGIDTGTAAAGDLVTAKVLDNVIDPATRRIVIEKNATLQGRIVHMEHRLDGRRHFLVTIRFDSPALMLDHALGIQDPTSVRKEEAARCVAGVERIESASRLPEGGTFVFPDVLGRFVTPPGCTSRWVTVLPAAK